MAIMGDVSRFVFFFAEMEREYKKKLIQWSVTIPETGKILCV